MKLLLILLAAIAPSVAVCQFGASFHQSSLPFAGINYEIVNRLRPELRIGTDSYFEDISAEGVLTYDILNKDDYELYLGLGIRVNGFSGAVIPLGVNFYPFTTKEFGFHIELAALFGENNATLFESEADILRGSWGIRYRFRKQN